MYDPQVTCRHFGFTLLGINLSIYICKPAVLPDFENGMPKI
jgi:hypothetical protein